MSETYLQKVNFHILNVMNKFVEYPDLFLTESDLKCILYKELDSDSVFSKIETTGDGTRKTNYVHSEIPYFVYGKLNKNRVDLAIVDPHNYDFSDKATVIRKGFAFKESSIGIELKLNKYKGKKGMTKELTDVLDALTSLAETRLDSTFILLFLDKKALFEQTEIQQFQEKYPMIRIHYCKTRTT